MKKYIVMFAIPILFLSTLVYAKTPMYSTQVDQGLAKMFNYNGLVDGIYWSNGNVTTWETLGQSITASTLSITGTTTIATVAGNVGIGTTTPGHALTIEKNQDAPTVLSLTNKTAGGAAYAEIRAYNNLGNRALVGIRSSTADSYGVLTAGKSYLYNSGPYGMVIVSDHDAGTVAIATGADGGTLRMIVGTETTFVGSVIMPANEYTTGSKTVQTGVNYDNTTIVQGSGVAHLTGSGSTTIDTAGGVTIGTTTGTPALALISAGSITASNGTVTFNLINMPQTIAVGSSCVYGTSWAPLATFVVPAKALGNTGFVDIYPIITANTSGAQFQFRFNVSDTIATVTTAITTTTAAMRSTSQYLRFANQGSTSVNFLSPFLTINVAGTANPIIQSTLDTNLPIIMTYETRMSTSTADYANMAHGVASYQYIP